MPSESASDFSQHKLGGFHLKHLIKRNHQTSTSSTFSNASNPQKSTNSQHRSGARQSVPSFYTSECTSSCSTGTDEIVLNNTAVLENVKVQDGKFVKISSRKDHDKKNQIRKDLSPKNCFKYFCTSAVKQLPHIYSHKTSLAPHAKKAKSVFESQGLSVTKVVKRSENEVLALSNDLTIEAIRYKCKILQLHDTKCGCASPRLHVYLTTNHRCSEKCSVESCHLFDRSLSTSYRDTQRNKYIFAIMTGKSKGKDRLQKIPKAQRARKSLKRKAMNRVTLVDKDNMMGKNVKKNLSRVRTTYNDEPESELFGEELPTIMNTLSGDVEYIVLDDNTFNLSANSEDSILNDIGNSKVTSDYAGHSKASDVEECDVKPNVQSLEKTLILKEGRKWENIFERCLSEVSYESGKNKNLSHSEERVKIKIDPGEEGDPNRNTDASSLAGVCTNHCPSIRDIFGDISIKDEPIETADDNDMSVEDFSQEIKKLTNPVKRTETYNKLKLSNEPSLNEGYTTKGLFAGLLKEDTKMSEEESNNDNLTPGVAVKVESPINDADDKNNDDYSSDSSLGALQIDEGEEAPAEEEEVTGFPVTLPPAPNLVIPRVNIISPFKIKIFFGNPHQLQVDKPHELFNTSINPSLLGTSSIPNSVFPNRSNKIFGAGEEEDSETDSLQAILANDSPKLPSLKCVYCEKVSPDIKALAQHFEDHQKQGLIICYFCQKSFGDKTSMKRHMRTHTGERPYQCKVCGKRFSLPGNFKKHRDIHEDIRTEPCEVCGKTFRRKEHLKYHMRTHTGEKPYTCTECGTSFTARYSLQIHMNIHLGKKPYKCSYCTKAFSDKSTMRKHLRVHTGEKPFHCGVCGKSFGESGTLASHMATHRSDRPYKCARCDLSFKTTGGLRQHEKIHTGEKQYSCRFCGMKFLQKYNMTMHERIHTGEKPYVCNYCEQSFRSRSCLTKHMLSHAGKEERRYECEHCNSRFYRKAHLRRHIDMHLGVKKYECDKCSKKFTTRISLDNHLKAFHTMGARRFPCTWCGRVFKRKIYINTHECIRDPVKVEQYKQEMRAASSNVQDPTRVTEENDNTSDTDYSSIDIKSEPEEVLESTTEGLCEINSVIGNANFDIQEGTIKPEPS